MTTEFKSSIRTFVATLELLKLHGVDQKKFFNHAGLHLTESLDIDDRVCLEEIVEWVDVAADLIEDKAVGLHAGEMVNPGFFGEMGFALLCSESLYHAFNTIVEFSSIMSNAPKPVLSVTDEEATLSEPWLGCPPEEVRALVEQNFASILIFFRSIISEVDRDKFLPKAMHFRHKKPEYSDEYDRIFGCPIFFEQDDNRIVFDSSILSIAGVSPSPEIHRSIVERLKTAKCEVNGLDFPDLVREFVENSLENKMPGMDEAAKHFHMSTKTFYRRLRDGLTSYSNICEEVRKNKAGQWVTQTSKSLFAIANELAYTDQSTFYRAFKRWYGVSPAAYRDNHLYAVN